MIRWILAVFSVISVSGCATFKAAEPQLVLCADSMLSQANVSALVNALEAKEWPMAVAAALADLGQAGICALQAIANAGMSMTSATALGVNQSHAVKAAAWLEARGIHGIATTK